MRSLKFVVVFSWLVLVVCASLPVQADGALQGYVREEDGKQSTAPSSSDDGKEAGNDIVSGSGGMPGSAPSHRRRVARKSPLSPVGKDPSNVVDLNDFKLENSGKPAADSESGRALLPTKLFDLGVDSNSRELVLAWEKWHKQLSGAIYYRTMKRLSGNNVSGSARLSIHVTKTGMISSDVLEQDGSPLVCQAYSDAVSSLNGNPGLTFPTGSQRDEVTFDYAFQRSPYLDHSGYDWKKDDFEKVRTGD
jgi:hypothetical protein